MRKNTNIHRRLYKEYYGEIPLDNLGRSYDIHHINGDFSDNSKENLIALSIDDHYAACQAIAMRLTLPAGHYSELMKQRYNDGTHPIQTRNNDDKTRIARMGGKASQEKRLKNGTHISQILSSDEIKENSRKGGEASKPVQKALLEAGVHPFQLLTPDEINARKEASATGIRKKNKQLSSDGKHVFQHLTTEQKRENALKAWATRRAKATNGGLK